MLGKDGLPLGKTGLSAQGLSQVMRNESVFASQRDRSEPGPLLQLRRPRSCYFTL
jgi:hypothetical protein